MKVALWQKVTVDPDLQLSVAVGSTRLGGNPDLPPETVRCHPQVADRQDPPCPPLLNHLG